MKETVIKKMYFGLTENTNKLKVTIITEDMSDSDQPITIALLDTVMYLFICKTVGDNIKLQKNGQYWNLVKESSSLGDFFKMLFEGKQTLSKIFPKIESNLTTNLYESFNFLKNSERIDVTEDEMIEMANERLDNVLKFADAYHSSIQTKKKPSSFCKYLKEQSELTSAKQMFNYTAFVTELSDRHGADFSKKYRLYGAE